EGATGHEDRSSPEVVVIERAEIFREYAGLLESRLCRPDRATNARELDHAAVTSPIVGADAQVPLPGGARQGPPHAAARLPVRLPRRSPFQAQVRTHRFTTDLRPQLRGLPPVSGGEASRGPDDQSIHRLSCP